MSFPSCNFSYNLPHLLSHSHCLFIRTVNRHGTNSISSPEDGTVPRGVPPDEPREDREPHLCFFFLNYIPSSARSYATSSSKASRVFVTNSRVFAISFLSVSTKSSLWNCSRASRANLGKRQSSNGSCAFRLNEIRMRGANCRIRLAGGRSPSRSPQWTRWGMRDARGRRMLVFILRAKIRPRASIHFDNTIAVYISPVYSMERRPVFTVRSFKIVSMS